MPRATLEAFADHGQLAGDSISGSYDDAARFLGDLKAAGIDFDDVTDQLEREGLARFEASWAELTATVAAELQRNHPSAGPTPK
jgi:transaldolase